MGLQVLERLTSEDFSVSVGFLSTASALRRFLRRTMEVREVNEALKQGAITENMIRGFVSSLMRDFHYGQRFPHELALSAIAVVLESWSTTFAEEFLYDLSALRLAEMSLCIRVARASLERRVDMTRNKAKRTDMFTVGQPGNGFPRASTERFAYSVVGLSKVSVDCGA